MVLDIVWFLLSILIFGYSIPPIFPPEFFGPVPLALLLEVQECILIEQCFCETYLADEWVDVAVEGGDL
jgi:hypothetical protein